MMWFYTETFKCILCTVWKPKEMNSNCHRCKLFLWGKATYRDSETAFVAHTRGISWVTPCMFTALLGLTLINANQKQISLTLTQYLSWLTADCTSYISQPCASETSHMETVQKTPVFTYSIRVQMARLQKICSIHPSKASKANDKHREDIWKSIQG